MSIIQDTQFSKKSCDKKKFDIENLNFKNLGIKTKNQSNKGLNPTLQDQTTEFKGTNTTGNLKGVDSPVQVSKKKIPFEEKTKEASDDNNLKIMGKTIENLRAALQEKNEEIRTLKRNFKEKINIIENENKKHLDSLDTKYKLNLDSLTNTYESKIKEIELCHKEYQKEFDENYVKFQKEISIFVEKHMEKSIHEETLTKVNNSWSEKFENLKSLFNRKLKEMMNFFDNPEYRILMEKFKVYMKFKDKFILDLKDDEKSIMSNLKNDEIEIILSKMKLHLLNVETGYLKGLSELEQKYQEYEIKFHQEKHDDKLENLKMIVLDKFSLLENINILGSEEKKSIFVPNKNSSQQIMLILNEFKKKKKIFSQNLDNEFNYTSSFIKDYELKNKIVNSGDREVVNKQAEKINLASNQNQRHILNDFLDNPKNQINRQSTLLNTGLVKNKNFDRQTTVSYITKDKIKSQIDDQIRSKNNSPEIKNKLFEREPTILKSDENTKDFLKQPTISRNSSNYTNSKSEIQLSNNKTKGEIKNKISLFSSEMDQNPVYDEENFTKFGFPNILNTNIRNFEEGNIIENKGNTNYYDLKNNKENITNLQSNNYIEENYIRLKTNK